MSDASSALRALHHAGLSPGWQRLAVMWCLNMHSAALGLSRELPREEDRSVLLPVVHLNHPVMRGLLTLLG
jgi:hypothetical protein